MARYLLKRLAALVGIIWIISVFCFLLIHLLPGDPSRSILGFSWTPASGRLWDKQHGFTGPLVSQYWYWLRHVAVGNLGMSSSGQTVGSIIGSGFKIDLELVLYSQILSFLFAIPLAVYAARRPGGKMDATATTTTFAFYCLPAFILVVWLVQLLCVSNHIFPGPSTSAFPTGGSFVGNVLTNLHVMFLPSFILAIGTTAVYYRLLRGEMAQTLQEEFITVARSKGLSNNRILWRHALRPSSITLLTSTGNNVALLLTGLFIVELKFDLPGVGWELVQGVPAKDYLLVQGIALVTAVVVVIVNFAIDIITTFVDPRIARA
ncbi:MAG TPA: ABC transporter permease [Acidimicrobiales bacterium]|nr:ABC transporter permease [Acidimicrobiales bacterium]